MKIVLACSVCILIGIGIGWYVGFNRPVAKNQRALLKQYQYTRDKFHMTDAEMADFGKHEAQYFAEMQRQDELAAALALQSFKDLEAGHTQRVKHGLATMVSAYYRQYSSDGNTNLIRHIVSYAATNAALSNAIYRKLQ
jgi:hypothetical protein